MASISSTGIGSGIDVGSLVSSLVAAEGASKSARLDTKEAQYTAKLSSLSTLKGAVSDFQSSYSSLRSVSTFTALTATSTNDAVFTVSAEGSAATALYDIDVTQLAVAQKLQTGTGYADSDSTSIGTGTLTFAFASDIIATNGVTHDITITDGTLTGIRDAINDADIGVNANIVFDGSDYEMVLTSQTGDDNQLTITQTSTTGDLSAFDYDSDPLGAPAVPTGNLTQTVASADAILTVDGVGVTSSSNSISNVIEDVTLELTGVGASEQLSISKDTSGVISAVQDFVDGYNTLMTSLNEVSAYNEGGQNGILIGDSSVRGIVSQLRSILNTTVGDRDTQFNSLASIGILTQRDGTLEYDSSELTSALSVNASEVQYLLAGGKATASTGISIESVGDGTPSGIHEVTVSTEPTQGTYSTAIFGARNDGLDNRFDFTGGATFALTVDGITSGAIAIPSKDYYTLAGGDPIAAGNLLAIDMASAANADATLAAAGASISIAYSTPFAEKGQFTISSSSYGAASTVDVSTALPKLQLYSAAVLGIPAVDGIDGAGTIGGIAATFDGQYMTGSGTLAELVINAGATAAGTYSVEVTDGLMDNLETLVGSFLDSDGIIDSKTDGLTSSIADISEQRVALNERLEKYEARLLKQFNAMDTIVAQLNTTSSFLTNQLEGLQKLSTRGS